jgi:hypothetical protein
MTARMLGIIGSAFHLTVLYVQVAGLVPASYATGVSGVILLGR